MWFVLGYVHFSTVYFYIVSEFSEGRSERDNLNHKSFVSNKITLLGC